MSNILRKPTLNKNRKKQATTTTTKCPAQLLGEAIVTYFCLEGILTLREYQQLAYMIIISQISRASLF